MYDKARRGEMIELSPRRISIYQFDIERSLEDRYSSVFPLFIPSSSTLDFLVDNVDLYLSVSTMYELLLTINFVCLFTDKI